MKVRTDEHQGVFSLVDSPARKFLFRSQMLSHILFSSSWLQLTDEAKGAGAASLINLDDQGHQLARINGKLVSVDSNLVRASIHIHRNTCDGILNSFMLFSTLSKVHTIPAPKAHIRDNVEVNGATILWFAAQRL